MTRRHALVGLLLVMALLAACGDTGGSGTSNVQGGTGRAPGAPPPAQATATATVAR